MEQASGTGTPGNTTKSGVKKFRAYMITHWQKEIYPVPIGTA